MRRWTWRELAHLNSYGKTEEQKVWRDKAYNEFIDTYGVLGMLALAIAERMPTNPNRGRGRPTPYWYNLSDEELYTLYRRMYWRVYGKKECED